MSSSESISPPHAHALPSTKTSLIIACGAIAGELVAVLEAGVVRQLGTHDELFAQQGPYRELWRIQGAFEEELADDLIAARGRQR